MVMKTVSLHRFVAWALSGSVLLAGCSTTIPQPPLADAPATAATSQAVGTLAPGLYEGNVLVNGRILPASSFELTLPGGAKITEVLVREGEQVSAGQPLVRLDVRALELQVKEAEANLAETRAVYEVLVAATTPEQQAEARAQIEQARAQLNQMAARVSPEDVAAARAELQAARQALVEATAGADPELVAISQAEVQRLQANLQSIRDTMSVEKQQAELRIERLANNVRDAQDYYSRVVWDNRRRYGEELSVEAAATEASALRAVNNAEIILTDARIELEQVQKNELNRLLAARAEVDQAENRLRQLLQGLLPSEISDLKTRIQVAEARVEDLTGPTTTSTVAGAQAQLAEAEAAYAQLVAEPSTPKLAVAEAVVQRSEAQLAQVQLQLEDGELRSPIDGVIADVLIEPGQPYSSNNVALIVADMSTWQIETDKLNELSVVHVREGDTATISFYALPGFTLTGKVTYITMIGQSADGDQLTSNYRLVIVPDSWDDRLRWNMTASVKIEAGSAAVESDAAGGKP